jgi:hypothetical protein
MDFTFLVHFVERLGEALKALERLGGGTAYLDDLVLALTNSLGLLFGSVPVSFKDSNWNQIHSPSNAPASCGHIVGTMDKIPVSSVWWFKDLNHHVSTYKAS